MILGGGATTRAQDRHQVLVFNPLSLGPLLGTAVRPSFSEAMPCTVLGGSQVRTSTSLLFCIQM